MLAVIDQAAELLALAPSPVLSADRLGARRPTLAGDVPAVVLAVTVDDTAGQGLGRLARPERLDGPDPDTAVWREAVRAERARGVLRLEVWGNGPAELRALVAAAHARLTDQAAARARGFLRLAPAHVAPAEQVRHEPAVGAPFPAWRQEVGYRFAFERLAGGAVSGGGVIRRVGVAIGGAAEDSLTVPATP